MPQDPSNKKQNQEYTAQAIRVIKGLDAVRKRPAMYIGSTGAEGLHHLVYEVVDNSVDEALAGYCDSIKTILHSDGSCSVEDNGRGIPVDMHPTEGVSAAEVVMTRLHAGGKFDKEVYKFSGGLHGVGVSVVNALSKELNLEVFKDGKIYSQTYRRGTPVAPLKAIGETDRRGTLVRFFPDPEIFQETTTFNFEILSTRLRELAFLNKGLRISIHDEINNKHHEFYFEGGIISFVQHINQKKTPLFPEVIHIKHEDDKNILDIAMQYNDGYGEQLFSFVNNINTVEGGTHVTGFKTALTKVCNKRAQMLNILKGGDSYTSEDAREGLVCVISIKIPEPQFEGQTKTKLGNNEIKGLVDSWTFSFLDNYFEENPAIARKILQKAELAKRAREAARKARELTRRKTVLEGLVLPGKLADCSNENPAEAELFIVEGDSAGGCFSGDTKIALVDGRNISFKELAKEHESGISHYCYTITKDGNIDIALIKHPRKTKTNAQVIKIILDNDEEIICTPDHLFMLKGSSYKKAIDLTTKDSLMPLYRKLSKREKRITIDGYEMVLDPKTHKWIFTHVLADKYNLKNGAYTNIAGSHKHHIEEKLVEAVKLYNHRIKSIIHLTESMDVYDLEVDDTHNFALASGIFVHNSAKQARDRFTQAILPLKGKILNVEKARLDKMLSNEEIRSLIAAIGCGISDEFDINKTRYHKLVLMADADVDGAHIRTLLLTFFFRYMKPLIEKGYLYIAQPPLYKVKIGKREQYLKDDKMLKSFLFNWAREQLTILLNTKELSSKQWNDSLDALVIYDAKVEETAKLFNLTYEQCAKLVSFMYHHPFKTTDDPQKLVENLKHFFKQFAVTKIEESVGAEGAQIAKSYIIFKILNRSWRVELSFFNSNEVTELLGLFESLKEFELKPWKLNVANKEKGVDGNSVMGLVSGILNISKPYMSVQRYKGLGEMNPEQLWETAMDPKQRNLLQVSIEDALEADLWFTTLMGDDVTGRKQFIEERGHFVKNLDV